MIRSFRDRRAERLFAGARVREFGGFERQAAKHLRLLDAADSLMALRGCAATGAASTASASTTNSVFVLSGTKMARTTSKSSTTTERPQREAIHPGEFLADELRELNMSASGLARVLRVPPNRVSQILAGKRAVSADTALRLGRYFGTGPALWLNLQQAYELDVAQKTTGRDLTNIPVRAAAAE